MKLKQIKTFLFVFLLSISAVTGSVLFPSVSSAYTCPNGQEFHTSDNACWTKDTKQPQKGTSCQGGYDYDSGSKTCVKYTRTNAQPKNEDGSTATLSCPSGQEYHTSDNKCWTKDTKPGTSERDCTGSGWNYNATEKRCVKYTESSDNPTISKDYYATYCESNFPQDTDACEQGQANGDCTGFANQAQKDACQEGVASNLCGVSDGTGTANSADARAECYSGVKECLANGGSTEAQKSCLGKVSGVDKKDLKKDGFLVGSDGTGINCGEAETVLIKCDGKGVEAIGNVLKIVITVMTTLIGIAAVGGLAWASILYAKAEDSEGNTKEAKELIRNIVIGLLLYGFLVAIVNWLVPGGVIGT